MLRTTCAETLVIYELLLNNVYFFYYNRNMCSLQEIWKTPKNGKKEKNQQLSHLTDNFRQLSSVFSSNFSPRTVYTVVINL